MIKTHTLLHLLIPLIVLGILLTGCNLPAFSTPEIPTLTPTSTFVVKMPTKSATPAISATPKLTRLIVRSPTPTPFIPNGLEAYTQPKLPNYVFLVNPAKWLLSLEPNNQYSFLKHMTIDGCELRVVPPMGMPLPLRHYPKVISKRRWWVDEYPASAFYHQNDIFLDLRGYRISSECMQDLELVLARMMTTSETKGEPTLVVSPTPTVRPSLENFFCPGTPPTRLRVGDHVLILAEGIYLRSGPRAADDTKLEQFLKYAPYDIVITGGPACETYTYWKVTMTEMIEGGKVTSGWLAEGDLKNYYLEPYEPDK